MCIHTYLYLYCIRARVSISSFFAVVVYFFLFALLFSFEIFCDLFMGVSKNLSAHSTDARSEELCGSFLLGAHTHTDTCGCWLIRRQQCVVKLWYSVELRIVVRTLAARQASEACFEKVLEMEHGM